MSALEILAMLGVTASLAVLLLHLWQLANTVTGGAPPPPPDDPPATDPEVEPPDPFDVLLVDLELFRITNFTAGSIE
jgi:hypothetical protein